VAAPSGQLKVSRYFLAFTLLIAVLYALVVFTGDKQAKPKLGLDLQGGTSITLSATVPGGGTPDGRKLEQARQIIANRVNGSGVAEAEVVTQGDRNIVVSVPGEQDADQLQALTATAEMRFRKVLNTTEDTSAVPPDPTPSATPSATPSGSASPKPSASATPKPTASAAPSASASPSAAASPTPAAAPTASPSAAAVSQDVERERAAVARKLGAAYQIAATITDPGSVDGPTRTRLAPFANLTGAEVAVLPVEMQFAVPTISCKQLSGRPVGSIQDLAQKVVACGSEGGLVKYLLDVAKVVGQDVGSADFVYDAQNAKGWKVVLSFKGSGGEKWTALTKEAFKGQGQQNDRVAIVLDNDVVSAPEIQSVIVGDAEITGSFTKGQAETLATQLKYGALPLSFAQQSLETVSPTLGLQQMEAGLLAGAIGLVLVVFYCLLYYRFLGFVVIASLAASAALVYASLVLLGRQLGYTLTLAGIAGFIVAIGITADSFVVFFERLKDEVRDGRTVRSAVPRAWVRARRTILSADTVSLLAAVVLYLLAAGGVAGFAFTLGLSTIIDLIIVFLFTHPLVALLSRWPSFTSPRISGLGNLRSDRAIAGVDTSPARRFGAVQPKES